MVPPDCNTVSTPETPTVPVGEGSGLVVVIGIVDIDGAGVTIGVPVNGSNTVELVPERILSASVVEVVIEGTEAEEASVDGVVAEDENMLLIDDTKDDNCGGDVTLGTSSNPSKGLASL